MIRLAHLTHKERNVFLIHTAYMALEGIVLGVLALNEFVFLKSLQGTDMLVGILFLISMAVFNFLLFFNEFLKRVKDRKRLLRITGILTRLPLALLFFFPTDVQELTGNHIYHYIFLAIFLIYFLGNPIIYPTINYLLKTNYKDENFSKLYSYATSLNKVIMFVVTLFYGYLLDADKFVFIYVYPVVAILGIASIHLLSTINAPVEVVAQKAQSFFSSVKSSAREMIGILKTNKPYLHFEGGFMFYGLAFMITYPVYNIFYYEELNLNYASVAFYRNSYNLIAIILLPIFGALMSKMDPRKFAIITYASLAAYILCLLLTEYIPAHFVVLEIRVYYTMIFFILFHGVFAATMVLLWNIGSSFFGKPEQAGTYQSIHLWLTGIRSLFAPILGVLFYRSFGYSFTFGFAIFLLILGMLLMVWSYYHEKDIHAHKE